METVLPQSYVPSEAYLFFPKKHETKFKDGQRTVFDGNTEFNEDEVQIIQKFRLYVEHQNYVLKPMWTNNMILRFLYACNFKMNKTLSAIKDHTIWRETKLPVQLDDTIKKSLVYIQNYSSYFLKNSGVIYVHGRDNRFRPIVILNADIDMIIRTLTFMMEYVIAEWMLPGQIETWVFVANLKGVGAATLALPSMRRLFSYLQENYKCRLSTLYMLNVAASMYVPWQVIKQFLDEVTVRKIQFYKTQIPTILFETTNREQVEEKYGGTAPNATQFWPPIIPSNNYFTSPEDPKKLISRERYTELYKKGALNNMRVNTSLIIEEPVKTTLSPHVTPQKNAHKITSASGSAYDSNIRRSISTGQSATGENNTLEFSPFKQQILLSKFASENVEVDNEFDGEANYTEHMEETIESTQTTSTIKHFKASFMSKVILKFDEKL